MLNWVKQKLGGKAGRAADDAARLEQQLRAWTGEGFDCLMSGQLARAGELAAQVLQARPEHADALYLSCVLESNAGHDDVALALITRAVASDAGNAALHHMQATLLQKLGRPAEALQSYRAAAQLKPDDADMQSDFGCALEAAGQREEAVTYLRAASIKNPANAAAHYNLGAVLQALGRDDEAAVSYREAAGVDPHYADAINNLGVILQGQGSITDAIGCFRRVVELQPAHASAWNNLACALQLGRLLPEAETCARHAIELAPRSFDAHSNLALILREQGRLEESIASSEQALALRESLGERIRLATLYPVVARSGEEIRQWRARFESEIGRLATHGGSLADPLRETGTVNFNLAYQPESNRKLQEITAQLYLKVCPSLGYVAPHCRKPPQPRQAGQKLKVGFISKFFFDHIGIGRTSRGLIAETERDAFEVIALFVPPVRDDATFRFIRDHADRHLILPHSLQAAREAIAALELDVLFYQDIGMEQFTYFLAYSRLAPVQCLSYGHPDTTGIPNMDYWVSSENFEREDSAVDYSERLFLLKNIGTLAYYYRPMLQAPAMTRASFGLDPDKHLFICPQSLFKIHPDFDAAFAGILRADPQAEIVLVQGAASAWETVLHDRYRQAMPDVYERIRFLPRLPQEDFLKLINVCDVMLDPFYFNGMNSSLEGFSVGIPIVTMPTSQQRGRHTHGMYRRMDIHDCVAGSPQEYIEIALKLGRDQAYRLAMKEKILARCPLLYEDPHVVREFERFYLEAYDAAASESKGAHE